MWQRRDYSLSPRACPPVTTGQPASRMRLRASSILRSSFRPAGFLEDEGYKVAAQIIPANKDGLTWIYNGERLDRWRLGAGRP